jgi:hypothetical protein
MNTHLISALGVVLIAACSTTTEKGSPPIAQRTRLTFELVDGRGHTTQLPEVVTSGFDAHRLILVREFTSGGSSIRASVYDSPSRTTPRLGANEIGIQLDLAARPAGDELTLQGSVVASEFLGFQSASAPGETDKHDAERKPLPQYNRAQKQLAATAVSGDYTTIALGMQNLKLRVKKHPPG